MQGVIGFASYWLKTVWFLSQSLSVAIMQLILKTAPFYVTSNNTLFGWFILNLVNNVAQPVWYTCCEFANQQSWHHFALQANILYQSVLWKFRLCLRFVVYSWVVFVFQYPQMYACILIFFTTNMIEGQLISTGAFEVSLNG